jgi:hypothetical protein
VRHLIPKKPRQVLGEVGERPDDHQTERAHGPQDGKDSESVRCPLEVGVSLEPLRSEADLL